MACCGNVVPMSAEERSCSAVDGDKICTEVNAAAHLLSNCCVCLMCFSSLCIAL